MSHWAADRSEQAIKAIASFYVSAPTPGTCGTASQATERVRSPIGDRNTMVGWHVMLTAVETIVYRAVA